MTFAFRPLIVGVVVIISTVTAGLGAQLIHDDPEHVPPHAESAVARITKYPGAGVDVGLIESGLFEAARVAAEEAEHERIRLERVAEEARVEAARRDAERNMVGPGSGPTSGYPAECANSVVPPHVAWTESRCRWDAFNPTGCDGYGCTGFYQIHGGHYLDPSPWGARGQCVGLDQWAVDQQTECASRLGRGAWAGG